MKNGFTLIELLAVIVILAIIALIATPIVLNIINETKESANIRSAEMYLDAVEQSIARGMLQNKYIKDGTYNITKDGDICLEGTTDNCTNTLVVEVEGEKPKSGNIDIVNGNIGSILLELNDNKIVKNDKGEVIFHPCKLIEDKDEKGITPGDKYECKVDPNKDAYTFYVLSDGENETTNLIMDSNINESGIAIKSNDITDKGYVAWINKIDFEEVGGTNFKNDGNSYGPLSAMDYLEKATSSWTNLTKMTIDKFDDENGTIYNMKRTYKVYARLPYYNEVTNTGCDVNDEECDITKTGCAGGQVWWYGCIPSWMFGYLYKDELGTGYQEYLIEDVYGYWTLSSDSSITNYAWYVFGAGDDDNDASWGYSGVRPVITVKL